MGPGRSSLSPNHAVGAGVPSQGHALTAVQADTDGSIPQDDLQSAIDAFKAHGPLADVTCSFSAANNGIGDVVGAATFADKTFVPVIIGRSRFCPLIAANPAIARTCKRMAASSASHKIA